MTKKTLKERHSQLKPIMKYLYFQKLDECHGKADLLDIFMTNLEKAGKLVESLLDIRAFSKPHDMYHYISKIRKPSPEVIQLAYSAFQITEEMTARCCYFYKKKGKLADLVMVSLTRVPGKERMKPWIRLFEREDLRTVDTRTAFQEWITTTNSGKAFAHTRQFYSYTLKALMEDTGLSPKVIIRKKQFPTPPIQKKENQRA